VGRFNQIGAARYARGLRALLGLEDQEGVGSVAPEIMPVIETGQGIRTEDLFVFGYRSYTLVQTLAAVAGEFSYIGLRNLAGSGVLAHVVACIITEPTASRTYNIRFDITDTPTTAAGVISSDRRTGTKVSTVQTITGAEAAATGANMWRVTKALDDFLWLPLDIVLAPGFNVAIENTTANDGFTAGFIWKERTLRDDELL
jgi:hypothetical protein